MIEQVLNEGTTEQGEERKDRATVSQKREAGGMKTPGVRVPSEIIHPHRG